MSYQTGTITSPTDLLQKLATWVTSVGWTVDSSVADGTGWRLHIHKGGVYVNFKSAISSSSASEQFDNYAYTPFSGVELYVGTGYNGANNWKTQPGGPIVNGGSYTLGVGSPMPPGSSVAYHFFSDETDDNFIIVMERTANIFTHFGWGTGVVKFGVWTGGPYFFGAFNGRHVGYTYTDTSPGRLYSVACPFVMDDMQGYVRADVDAFTSKWIGCNQHTVTGYGGYTGKNGNANISTAARTTAVNASGFHVRRITSSLSGQSLLVSIYLSADRDAGGFSYLGRVPNIFLTNACAMGFTPSSIYTWGGDEYMVFPGPDAAYGTNWDHYGFAVKKV
jgi:hypothetical protein